MAFNYKKDLNANGEQVLMTHLLKSSTAIAVGTAVKLVSGRLEAAGAGGVVYGILTSIVKGNRAPVADNGAGGSFTGTYTTGASTTVCGVVDINPDSIWSVNALTAAGAATTLGTTTGSNLAGYNMDVLAASTALNEETAATTTAQFFSFGPDPEAPTTRVLVKIKESMLSI